MEEITKAQQGRIAIRMIKTTVDALSLRGYYKPSGRSGQTLAEGLRLLRPEIYGSMNNPRIIELKGLEYVIDRLPRGIEECTEIVLTAQDTFENTSFEKIEPPKRRRASYRVSAKEMCFIITRGLSEIYDIITHITFLNNEAIKIKNQISDLSGQYTREWGGLEKFVKRENDLNAAELERAIWMLSIILGRTYQETWDTYNYLEQGRVKNNSNRGLFNIIYSLGKRLEAESQSRDNQLLIYFTPSLKEMIGHQHCARQWAIHIKDRIFDLNLQKRPLHIISANLHSVINVLYGYAALKTTVRPESSGNIYEFFNELRDKGEQVRNYAVKNGLYELPDQAGAFIDCQLIDTALMDAVEPHPEIRIDLKSKDDHRPVILVMDYAFGAQAFEVMDELLKPLLSEHSGDAAVDDNEAKHDRINLNIQSVSVMGKAGILTGHKGDIMLATAHIIEGTAHNYIVNNTLQRDDFESSVDVYTGPIVTVLGTSLQNKYVLEKLKRTSWKAVGLEMEGGHYQRAINAAIIRKHIPADVKISYAYYASDNPLFSDQTLASGSIGTEGIKSTYMITKVILEKVFQSDTFCSD
ncbi:hypothetical protein QUF75_18710 [Desulfococcaceae bacterium HSG7]|nr:hypothetical protein [Desulfococcaceae bacterium HSG7]